MLDTDLTKIINALERIAGVQEELLRYAKEARASKESLAKKMEAAFKKPFQEEGDR